MSTLASPVNSYKVWEWMVQLCYPDGWYNSGVQSNVWLLALCRTFWYLMSSTASLLLLGLFSHSHSLITLPLADVLIWMSPCRSKCRDFHRDVDCPTTWQRLTMEYTGPPYLWQRSSDLIMYFTEFLSSRVYQFWWVVKRGLKICSPNRHSPNKF